MTQNWYNELYTSDYIYGDEFNQDASEFTQLVWAESKTIVCGIGVTSSGNGVYGVAVYTPNGNIGDFADNVLPPLDV